MAPFLAREGLLGERVALLDFLGWRACSPVFVLDECGNRPASLLEQFEHLTNGSVPGSFTPNHICAIVAEPMSPQGVTAFVTSEVRKWGPIARHVMMSP